MRRRTGLPILSAPTLLACSPTEQQEVQNKTMPFTAKVESSKYAPSGHFGANYATPLGVACPGLNQNPYTELSRRHNCLCGSAFGV